MPINIVFLFDLNSFPPGNDLEVQHKYLKWLQEHILTLVSKAATDESSNDVDYTKVMWTFKFYNSAKDVDYRNKKFEPFTIASFEAFESAINQEYDKFRSCHVNQDCSEWNRSSCLSQALMRVTSDLRWDENSGKKRITENVVYAILRVPRDDDELLQFADSNEDLLSSPNSQHVLKALLPSAFLKAFHQKYHIQLNFIDTWVLHKHENLEKEWNGQDYSRQIIRVLDYLDHGTAIQLQKSQPGPPGLPSYFTLLKNSLRQATGTSPSAREKLSEAQKVLQSSRTVLDSSRLDSSFSSVPGSVAGKPREKYRKLDHKENRTRVSGSHYKKLYPGLRLPSKNGKASPDSTTSEDMGSSVFGKAEEYALNRYVQKVNTGRSGYPRGKVHRLSTRNLQMPSSAPQQKYRRSPQHSGRDSMSILSGTNVYSRAHQMLSKATEKEWQKWSKAITKEEEERRVVRDERRKYLSNLESFLLTMKTRLHMYLEKCDLKDVLDMDKLLPAIKEFQDHCLADENLSMLSLSQTVVQFVTEKLHANNIHGQAAREVVERDLYIPIADLRAKVLKSKNDDDELAKVFRLCQLQILIRMEASWLVPDDGDSPDILKDEIVDLLSLLIMYMRKPVDDFMSNILVQGYMETHSEMLMRLYRGLSMDAPRNLILCVTPSKSIRSRASLPPSTLNSPFGSTESLFHPPSQVKCKAKLKDLLKREESFASQKSSARYASHVYVNNPKKMIMVPVRNVKKFSTMPKSPKPAGRTSRVRRNLFDSDGSKRKGSVQGFGRLSQSPSLAGSGKLQGTLFSPRVRSLRSKRKLNLDDEDEGSCRLRKHSGTGSPDMFSPTRALAVEDGDILCPATPSDKPYNSCKKLKRSSSHKSTSDRVVEESPELPKSGFSRTFSQTMHSLSFYSTGSDSFKSRAWEKSGNKMMAAKIKRTIDSSSFMNSGLTLSDLEILGGASSPESKSVDHNFQSPRMRPRKAMIDESPCCSKTLKPNGNSVEVEVVQANVNPNIEALIRSDQSLSLLKTTPKGNGMTGTPTKKISFNFDERLIRTPNRNSPGTPKSILKTPNREDGSARKGDSDQNEQQTPIKQTHFEAGSISPPKILDEAGAVPTETEKVQPEDGNDQSAEPGSKTETTVGVPKLPVEENHNVGQIIGVSLLAEQNDSEPPAPSYLDLLGYPIQPEFDQQIFQLDSNIQHGYAPSVPYDAHFPNYSIYRTEFPDPLSFPQYGHIRGGNFSSQGNHLESDSQQPLSGLTDL